LQAINSHANQIGDLLGVFSSLDEIPDLLDSFRGKPYQPSTSRELRGKGLGLQHLFILISAVLSSPYASSVIAFSEAFIKRRIVCINVLGSGHTKSGDQKSLNWLPGF
jgi:hypothetical protein